MLAQRPLRGMSAATETGGLCGSQFAHGAWFVFVVVCFMWQLVHVLLWLQFIFQNSEAFFGESSQVQHRNISSLLEFPESSDQNPSANLEYCIGTQGVVGKCFFGYQIRDGQFELLGGEAEQLHGILSVKRGFAFRVECRALLPTHALIFCCDGEHCYGRQSVSFVCPAIIGLLLFVSTIHCWRKSVS